MTTFKEKLAAIDLKSISEDEFEKEVGAIYKHDISVKAAQHYSKMVEDWESQKKEKNFEQFIMEQLSIAVGVMVSASELDEFLAEV